MLNKLKTILVLLSVNFSLFAQSEGALFTSTFQQSSMLFGSGQIGVSVPNDEVLGFYFNPAILGYSGRNNHASFSISPSKNKWFSFGNYKPTTNAIGLNLGYNFRNSSYNLPISIGFGYSNYKFSFGDYNYTSAEGPTPAAKYESYDMYNSFSFGIGFEYLVRFNLGLSVKSFKSKLGANVVDGDFFSFDADGTMIDYGALMIFPISELLLKNQNIAINNSTYLFPNINFNLGYSISNIGDKLYYVDPSQSDPLSRIARFGYNIDFGFGMSLNNTKINVLNYSFTAEANDILISPRNEENQKTEYQGMFGEISVADNLINLKSKEGVSVHKGHIFNILETVTLTSGRIIEHGNQSAKKMNGFGFSTKGIFKYLNSLLNNNTLRFVTKHFDISYFQSTYEIEGSFFDQSSISINEISLIFKGFEI